MGKSGKSKPPSNGNGRNQRDGKGRFIDGNTASSGNPYVRQLHDWRKAFYGAVTPADMKALAKVLLKQAKAGEPWAIKEVLDRMLGKPRQALEISGAEGGPLLVAAVRADIQHIVLDEPMADRCEQLADWLDNRPIDVLPVDLEHGDNGNGQARG